MTDKVVKNGQLKGPLFPGWDRHIRLATVVLCIGAGGYTMLFADFGPKEHCFSPLRRLMHQTFNSIGGLSEAEERAVADHLSKTAPPTSK
eukprot:CFRG0246T1